MSKTKLQLIVGKESTPEELDIINQFFSKDFDIKINNSYMRLGEGDLPMIIFIRDAILSGITFEILKNLLIKFFRTKPIKRKTTFVVLNTEKHKEMIVGENYFAIHEKTKETKYETIEEVFEDF